VKPIPITEALQQVGSVTRLAAILGVTRTSIYRWIKDGAVLPELYHYRWVKSQPRSRKRA